MADLDKFAKPTQAVLLNEQILVPGLNLALREDE